MASILTAPTRWVLFGPRGPIDQTLPALTQSATADAVLEVVLDSVLPGLTQDVTAVLKVPPEAVLDVVLPALSQGATAEAILEAVLDSVLPAIGQGVTAEALLEALIDSVLPALSQDATATPPPAEAGVDQTLPALTQSMRILRVNVGGGVEGWVVHQTPYNPRRRMPRGGLHRGGLST